MALGFGFLNPKLVGRLKVGGGGLPSSKRKSKTQLKSHPNSPKIGVASSDLVLVSAASSEVTLLPAIVSEEARQDGLLP